MNVVSFENIYSFYPYHTFVKRQALEISTDGHYQEAARSKYKERGWKLLQLGPWDERVGYRKWSPFRAGPRFVGDRYTLTIPLDMTGVQMISPHFAGPLRDCLTTYS